MALHLFVDTNVFLSFYAVANDDLEQLNKIVEIIKTGEIKLYVTQQVEREWLRNREGKIVASLAELRDYKLNPKIPRFMDDYQEISKLRIMFKEAEQLRTAALKRARTEAEEFRIAADELIQRVFRAAHILHTTTDILAAAQNRMAIGDPPGKADSLGDRINWEHLLAAVPQYCDLHIISKDGDFSSPLTKDTPSFPLQAEWQLRKQAKLHLHTELRPFLRSHFPQFRFARDIAKAHALTQLATSKHFTLTMKAILALDAHFDLIDKEDVKKIMDAGLNNSNVFGNGHDSRIRDFYAKVVMPVYSSLTEEERQAFDLYFDISAHEEDYEGSYEPEPDTLNQDHVQLLLDQIEEEYGQEESAPPTGNDDERPW
jgi:predicted nucleic acid-binding protein